MSAGRVTVDGKVITELGTKVDPLVQQVQVDGITVSLRDEHSYLMLHKPAGYLTTMDDPHGRPTVKELIPSTSHPGLFPVGRLDLDTTGLLLFMTNGNLAHQLLHPKHHVKKCYQLCVDGVFTEEDAVRLRQGIMLNDGMTLPAEVQIQSAAQDPALNAHHLKQFKKLNTHERIQHAEGKLPVITTELSICITEGRKRQIKRMCAEVGHPVVRLHRASFGPLELGDVPLGSWRYLSSDEVNLLVQSSAQD
jgi:23S rRNA pseudouridine2605 synthase